MLTHASAVDEWLDRVRSEYLEMPGHRLTLAQAARFWSLEPGTCAMVLDVLVKTSFLTVTSEGLYARAGSLRDEGSTCSGRLVTTATVEQHLRPGAKGRI